MVSVSLTQILGTAATVYGIVGTIAPVLQARMMYRRKSSEGVSLGSVSIVAGGYIIWLVYGVAIGSMPLILVDALGLVTGLSLLVMVFMLRKSPGKVHPRVFSELSGNISGVARGFSNERPGVFSRSTLVLHEKS